MSKCQQCGADLPPRTEGKRKRKFCDNNNKCKQSYYSKNKPKDYVKVPVEEYEALKKANERLIGMINKRVEDEKNALHKMASETGNTTFKGLLNLVKDGNSDAVSSTDKYPSDFNGLLKFAKEGKVENKEEFKAWVNAQRLTSNQRDMIFSKL